MPRDKNKSDDDLCSAAFARIEEIKSVRYVKASHNLTDNERSRARLADARAHTIAHRRLSNSESVFRDWLEDLGPEHAYCWAMSPEMDTFADLLAGPATHSAEYRTRLPGVTVEDVERRIQYLADAVEARIEQIRGRTMKQGRTR